MINAHFNKIEQEIVEQINKSKYSIDISVSWFTNKRIFDLLKLKSNNGIRICLLILNDSLNNNKNGLDFQFLIKAGVKLHMCDGPVLMHNKFCIIDESILITGSCNWTNNMDLNDENIIVIDNQTICSEYKKYFNVLLNKYKQVNNFIKVENEHVLHDNFIKIIDSSEQINYNEENLLMIDEINFEKEYLHLILIGKYDKVNGTRFYGIYDKNTQRYVSMPKEELIKLKIGDFIIFPKEQKNNISKYIDKNGINRDAYWMINPILKAKDFIKSKS